MREGDTVVCDVCDKEIQNEDDGDLGDIDWIYYGLKHNSSYNMHECPDCHGKLNER